MTFLSIPILTFLIFFPIVSALLLLPFRAIPNSDRTVRILALVLTCVEFLISLDLLLGMHHGSYQMQFTEDHLWIPFANIHYSLGVDGISIVLIVMTTFLLPMCVLTSWKGISTRVVEFMMTLLILEGIMVAVFSATDFVLFYVFWEAMLIPMYLIIGVWGGPNRLYATIKFFLYTLAGSLLLLLVIISLYFVGGHTFNIVQLMGQHYSRTFQDFAFLAMFAAFAVKVPMFPFHTWLPDAHVEAPTAGSVILASVMLKMGAYGFLRFSLPMFPDASHFFTPLIFGLSLAGIIWGAMMALAQEDMKKLIAYSSVSHMGIVTLGIFVFNYQGIEGAMMGMINHGVTTGALFLCVGVLYDRTHSRQLSDYGGIAKVMPIFSTMFMIFSMSSLGLPGLNSFVGEFLVLLGTFRTHMALATLATTVIVLAALYMLYLLTRVIWGVYVQRAWSLPDLNRYEWGALLPLVLVVIWIGVEPNPLLSFLHASVSHLIGQVQGAAPLASLR
uniref:NADH quinone oxidoreductase M subunit n=1 Tax=Leptospirillum ferriphilum TaxID=178606 RepID=K4EQ76_9BACT|nr:NADH quinone oxidoreductase M subunit [Leptospirillum ferriphilum]